MKERFTIRGTFKGKKMKLTWEDSKILGDQEAVKEYWKREAEYSGNKWFGLHPDVSLENYHLNPIAAVGIFFEILPDAVVIEGKDFYEDMFGKNDPSDAIY